MEGKSPQEKSPPEFREAWPEDRVFMKVAS
jgi:hypothetical protein